MNSFYFILSFKIKYCSFFELVNFINLKISNKLYIIRVSSVIKHDSYYLRSKIF